MKSILQKMPSRLQWRQFFKVLTKKEKILFFVFLILAILSASFLSVVFYFENTKEVPAMGGILVEGMIGRPTFINPIYPLYDVDRDLTELIFSGLMKYNSSGQIIPDLAKEYNISEDGKIVEVYLKDNIFWHDGQPLTTEDVVFTIETVQDPEYFSPLLVSWLGVKAEEISAAKVRFRLESPSSVFLENLTLKILPKHIWEKIPPESFRLSVYNLNPIGSGPYKFKSLEQDKEGKIISLDLVYNKDYFGKTPNLEKISFLFFDSEDELAKNISKIKSFSSVSKEKGSLLNNNFSEKLFSLPRYFTVFFNPEKSKILAEEEVRQALNYATDKNEILEKVFAHNGKVVDSPIMPGIYGFAEPAKIYQFNREKAKEILEEVGFMEGEGGLRVKTSKKEKAFQFEKNLGVGDQSPEVENLQKCLARLPDIYPEGEITSYFGSKTKDAVINFQKKYVEDVTGSGFVGQKTRAKLNEICFENSEETSKLKFSIATVNQPIMVEIANILKNQWSNIGAEIEIRKFEINELEQNVIKKRDYESILFGQVLGTIPDPFPFWHSSQKKEGLNLACYENKDADTLLIEARQILDSQERAKKYQEFQDILIEDAPAVFLISPDFVYFVTKDIKGIDLEIISGPSKRFLDVENWYIKTKRAWK